MLYLGISGWYYDDWVDTFYPRGLPKNQWLPYYSQEFNAVEVNASFYRLPFKNMIKGWDAKTPEGFFFTFKGSRTITHHKKLLNTEHELSVLYSRLAAMENHQYNVLWQLPPSLQRDDDLLERFLSLLDDAIDHIIEFRHASWFTSKVYTLLEKYSVAFCIVSCPGLPEDMPVTSDFAYIRWHGKKEWYDYAYSNEELNDWAQRIQNLNIDTVFGYFNNTVQAFAPGNCKYLQKILEKT